MNMLVITEMSCQKTLRIWTRSHCFTSKETEAQRQAEHQAGDGTIGSGSQFLQFLVQCGFLQEYVLLFLKMLLKRHFFFSSLSQGVIFIYSQVQTEHLSGADVLVSPICNYFFPQSSCQRGNRLERAESEQCKKKTLGAREAWV